MKSRSYKFLPVLFTLVIIGTNASANPLGSGVCLIIPPGFTAAPGGGGAPTIQGSEGQILRRSTTGVEWIDITTVARPHDWMPTPAQANSIPNTRTIAGFPLTANITAAQLAGALHRVGNVETIFGVGGRCGCTAGATTGCTANATVYATSNTAASNRGCWCYKRALGRQRVTNIVRSGSADMADVATCHRDCDWFCKSNTGWRTNVAWPA
jgi:hypothetical protein